MGSFSYGIYVVHFPIIQTMIALGLVAAHPGLAMGLIVVLVGGLSVASWHFVEQPWLRRRGGTRRRVAVGG